MENKRSAKKALHWVGIVAACLVSAVLLLGVFSMWWVMDSFAYVSMPEVVSTAMNLYGTPASSYMPYVVNTVLPLFGIIALIALVWVVCRFLKVKNLAKKMAVGCLAASLVLAVPTAARFWDYLDMSAYIHSLITPSKFIDDNYANPVEALDDAQAGKKRNLIMIFLESTEITYSDKEHGGYFDVNYMPELTELALSNDCFNGNTGKLNGSHTIEYTSWTMAAMFAHTSGLPFKTSLGTQNDMDTQEEFFPGVTSLGDVLAENGYDQYFYCGSNATFGGRRLYLTEHGNFKFRDYNYYHALPEDDPNHVDHDGWWGYEDFHLFDFIKQDVKTLADNALEGTPFNLTALTVDTHFNSDAKDLDGHLCELCGDPMKYPDSQYGTVISCDSAQVADFVSWFYDPENIPESVSSNTTTVLVGDHTTMSRTFCVPADEDGYDRRTYVCYINSAVEQSPNTADRARIYCPFDTYPTTLASLGFKINGDRLALGTNLYSSKPTLCEIYGVEKVSDECSMKSELLENLLDADELSYAYLERKGYLPTAEVGIDGDGYGVTASLSNILSPKLKEGFSGAYVDVYAIGGETRRYEMEQGDNEREYSVFIPNGDLPEDLGYGYLADFFLIGEKSGNEYTFDSIGWENNETI